jgi:tRNA (guanine37-N1)-methyltransferase
MIKFDVVTLFPQLFTEHFANLPFKKAIEKNLAQYNLWNLRDFATDKRGTVDDKTYGGGVGMVLMVEPIYKALETIYGRGKIPTKTSKKQRVVVLTPRGEIFTQQKVKEFSECEQITLLCGRYEGIDARVEENIATDSISLGNFVLSGGELPALSIMESVTRVLHGVLEKKDATEIESFSDGNIEYPQYTRPEDFIGMKIPGVLKNGNHKEIDKWRQSKSKKAF